MTKLCGSRRTGYDAAMDQFVYAWRLATSGAGATTIGVTITYPGSTSTTQLTLPITVTS